MKRRRQRSRRRVVRHRPERAIRIHDGMVRRPREAGVDAACPETAAPRSAPSPAMTMGAGQSASSFRKPATSARTTGSRRALSNRPPAIASTAAFRAAHARAIREARSAPPDSSGGRPARRPRSDRPARSARCGSAPPRRPCRSRPAAFGHTPAFRRRRPCAAPRPASTARCRSACPPVGHADRQRILIDDAVARPVAAVEARDEVEESGDLQIELAGAQRRDADLPPAFEAEQHRQRQHLIDVAVERGVEQNAARLRLLSLAEPASRGTSWRRRPHRSLRRCRAGRWTPDDRATASASSREGSRRPSPGRGGSCPRRS